MMRDATTWAKLKAGGATAAQLAARSADEGVDLFTRVRLLRSTYGLSLAEAKRLAAPDSDESEGRLAAEIASHDDGGLTIADEEVEALKHYPPYVVHALRNCAGRVTADPEFVYTGIRRDGLLRDGFAFCRRLDFSVDNHGEKTPPPKGMTFVVYAAASGHVFDWDWVRADKAGAPLDAEKRFAGPAPKKCRILSVPPAVTVGRFKPRCASYSKVGDCIFAYVSNEPSYAQRIDDDLTVFVSLRRDTTLTGLKLKNVERNILAVTQGDVKAVENTGVEVRAAKGAKTITIGLRVLVDYSRVKQEMRSRLLPDLTDFEPDPYLRVLRALERRKLDPAIPIPEAFVLDHIQRERSAEG
ncbi:MAG: hypothetical protein AB2A00_05740 [Myxococcota bacterium]